MVRLIDRESGQLWTVSTGSGVPIALSSGGPGCCDYLGPVAALIEGQAQVVRYDARGCGRSTAGGPHTILNAVADLEAIRTAYGFERWVVAGHSWGADLALAYACIHPERVLGLVCISGARVVDDRQWHEAYRAGRDAGLELPLDYALPPNMDVNRQLNEDYKAYIKQPHLLREIAAINRSALFVYGDADIRPSWPTEQIANLMPRAELHLLASAGHNLWQSHARELQELLTTFLDGLDLT